MNSQIKTDLARSLADENTRQAYLHPKKQSIFQIYKYAYKPIKSDKKLKVSSFFYSLVTGLSPILSAFILSYLVWFLSGPNPDITTGLKYIGLYCLAYLILTVSEKQIYYRTYNDFSKIRINFLHDFLKKMMTMDYGLYENSDFLDHISRGLNVFSGNSFGLEGSYHKVFDLGGQTLALILLGLILSFLSPWIFLGGLVMIFVFIKLKDLAAAYQHKRADQLNTYDRKLSSFSQATADFKKGKDLRLYFFKDLISQKLEEFSQDYGLAYKEFKKVDRLLSPVLALIVVAIEGLAYYLLYGKISAGDLSIFNLSLFISGLSLFIVYVNKIADGISFINRELLYFQDAIDFFSVDLNSKRGEEALDLSSGLEIEFKNVTFSYPNTEKVVLDNLSFKVEKGQRLALVGVNGAGKSTIAKLLLGLYKPTGGQILLNGIDIEDISLSSLNQAMTGVFQEVEPLAMTIGENLVATNEAIDADKAWKVLDQVGLGDKVRAYEKQLDTPLTKIIHDDGTLLSGGENQKLAIARALYKDSAKLIIMDEPTASLDALAEEKIYKDLDQIIGAKSLIFISHRLASTRFCDKILLLDGGSIAECGTHKELLAKNGLYKKMFDTQGKYYLEGEEGSTNEK